MNYKNFPGLSLLELVIVMCILTIVSAAVVKLSVSTLDHSKTQEIATSQVNLNNEIQDDIKNDLRNAFAVSISDGTSNTASCPNNFYTLKPCGDSTPDSIKGNTLDIVKVDNYNKTTNQTTFSIVRYQFVDYSYAGKPEDLKSLNAMNPGSGKTTLPSLVRFERHLGPQAGVPGSFWPKKINPPNNAGCKDPGYSLAGTFDVTALGPDDKIYNDLSQIKKPIAVTAKDFGNEAFEGTYGDKWSPPVGSLFTNCSYYIKNVNLHELTFIDQDRNTIYDKAFADKVTLRSPEVSFEVNISKKFF